MAVSLKKKPAEHRTLSANSANVPVNKFVPREYTPVHLMTEEETIKSMSSSISGKKQKWKREKKLAKRLTAVKKPVSSEQESTHGASKEKTARDMLEPVMQHVSTVIHSKVFLLIYSIVVLITAIATLGVVGGLLGDVTTALSVEDIESACSAGLQICGLGVVAIGMVVFEIYLMCDIF